MTPPPHTYFAAGDTSVGFTPNTALERMVDLIGLERQPLARDAKDLAAAGVLIASLCS